MGKTIAKFKIPFTRTWGVAYFEKPYWPFAFYLSNGGQRRALISLIIIEFEFIWVAKDYWVDGVGHYLDGTEYTCKKINEKYAKTYLEVHLPPMHLNNKWWFICKYDR